ncbi:hypothetical protein ACOJUR_14065 [Alicyclobacillus tolerans]|uniref:hypothetical protein n=1 Tax=Alicyclobacillus tolerans TaxID=90970 RepID=UPI003B81BA70
MSISASQLVLYAATTGDLEKARGIAAALQLPSTSVQADFYNAWNQVTSGDYLVIAVGGAALDSLYYNQCGWSNPAGEAGGSTPFAIATAPRDTLPGANYFVNGAGATASDTLYISAAYAYYALYGVYPAEFPSPPTPEGPSAVCESSFNSDVPCPCSTTGNYYGGDSRDYQSVSCGSFDFYGKPTGYGVTPTPACSCSTCISNAASVYSLWTLQGPGDAGSYSTSEWGTKQAEAAISQLQGDSSITGKTIFFDVELASGGWGTNQTANQEVLEAALSYIASTSEGYNPGVYISIGSTDNKWNYYFGSSYVPSTPFVLWAALHQCYSCSEAESMWPNYYQSSPINAGGQEIVIAQYSIGEVCSGVAGDLDYMRQDPKSLQFQPVSY